MKVYFSGSLYPQNEFQSRYMKIVNCLVSNGHEVMEDTTVSLYPEFLSKTEGELMENYSNVLRWIEKCDFAVFEASYPSSLSIGHEISVALGKGKPVIVMYLDEKSPKFLLGNKNDMIIWARYFNDLKRSDIDQALSKALETVKNKVSMRFNLFIPRSLMAYLDWAAKDTGVNKSEYIRMLIEKGVKRK